MQQEPCIAPVDSWPQGKKNYVTRSNFFQSFACMSYANMASESTLPPSHIISRKRKISTRRRWASVAVTGYTDDDSGQSCSPWDLGRRLPHHFHRKSPTMCNHPMLCCRTLFYSFYCNMFMGMLFLEEYIVYE